ncbi:MAG: hypothetical protein N3G21_10250 [Candidatus Hydrogenedentes bacterium]|nr:hypothetical protein [Candidatus Hydrogenedentota bacterium]
MWNLKAYLKIITFLIFFGYLSNGFSVEEYKVDSVIVDCAEVEAWAKVIDVVKNVYQDEGYKPKVLDINGLFGDISSVIERADIWVIVPGNSLPPATSKIIERLLESGKALIVFSAPIWEKTRFWDGVSLLSIEDFLSKYRDELMPERDLVKEVLIQDWKRESNNISSPVTLRYVEGCKITDGFLLPGIQVQILNMVGWDVFASPFLDKVFEHKEDVTVFFAKGGHSTNYLTLEWRERDSSRWLTSVPLKESWNYYVLTPEMFKFWDGPPERRGTQFNPDNAVRLCFGLTMSHSPISPGRHKFWIAGLGTMRRAKVHEIVLSQDIALPRLELLYPGYKFYESASVDRVRVFGELLPSLDGEELLIPKEFFLLHPRPGAGGFNKGRNWRWAPIVECLGEHGEYRGALSALMVHTGGRYTGSVLACFSVRNPQWYLDSSTLRLFKELVRRMRAGVYFLDSGGEFYTYFPEQAIRVGANIVNLAHVPRRDVKVEISLYDKLTKTLITKKDFYNAEMPPGGRWKIEDVVSREGRFSQEMLVESRLFCGETQIESVVHEINIWTPKEKKEFITVKNGDFIYKGRRWCPYGVNYMPSSGIGVEDNTYFEFWLGAKSYDPNIIQRDLERIVKMGMNSISVFLYHQSMRDQNLLDLLYRADKLGLKVNLSLRPGTPFDFEWEKVKEMIEFYRLADHDEVFAYDLAWEPMFPGHEGRKRWDREWEEWVINRYCSIESAEEDWKYPIPKDANGAITNPADEQLMKDGDWRVMACAYRRFLDTLLYKYYSRARRLVRSVDSNHAVSFRMTESSNPTNPNANPLPYDWYYLAYAVDILEPEGYGRIGSWEKIKPAIFQVQYGRMCNSSIPLIWAEMGFNVYRGDEKQFKMALDAQARFYKDFLRMVAESGSDGIYFWWYPGGYRVNEKSDFGIINPDGTFRPVSEVIKERSNIFDVQKLRTIDYWVEIDRDLTARGIPGVYELVKDEFWKVWEDGKFPGLKTPGTNTTSADCALVAIGNTPYNEKNPPKYLDSFFDRVVLRLNTGEDIEINDYEATVVLEGEDVKNLELLIEVTNLGEAKWLSSGEERDLKEGCVYLSFSGLLTDMLPIPKDVCRGESIAFAVSVPKMSGEINFYLESWKRAKFGEKRRINFDVR